MKAFRLTAVVALLSIIGLLSVGCHRPEYLNPYGEGVDPATVATKGFQSRPTSSTTGFQLSKPTTTTLPTKPTIRIKTIPEGYMLCPTCHGELQKCRYCEGTDKRQGETLDADSGVFKRYYIECQMCSDENPGYDLCQTCLNQLIVKK